MSTLKIAAIQYDIHWLDKSSNLSRLDIILNGLAPVDLILLPETFSTGFSIDVRGCEDPASNGNVLQWMQLKAAQLNAVIAGSVLVENQNKKSNRFYWVSPDGQYDYYDKRHLFRLGNEQAHVIAGSERKIFQLKGIRILPLVCYDLRFPVWSRNQQDYDLIVYVANWPAVRSNVWDTLLIARAMENQAYVVGVNRIGSDANNIAHSGGTVAINFLGDVLSRAQDNQQAVVYTTIELATLNEFKKKFPAYLDADNFQLET